MGNAYLRGLLWTWARFWISGWGVLQSLILPVQSFTVRTKQIFHNLSKDPWTDCGKSFTAEPTGAAPAGKISRRARAHSRRRCARLSPRPCLSPPCRRLGLRIRLPLAPLPCFECAHAMPNSLLLSAQHSAPQHVPHSKAQVPLQAHSGETRQVRALEPTRASAFDGTVAPQSPSLQPHGRNRVCGAHHGTVHTPPQCTHL